MFAFNLHEFGDFNDTDIPKPVIDLKTQETLREYYAIQLKTLRATQDQTQSPVVIPPLFIEAEVTDKDEGIVRNIPTPVISPRVASPREGEASSDLFAAVGSDEFDESGELITNSMAEGENTHAEYATPSTDPNAASSDPTSPNSPAQASSPSVDASGTPLPDISPEEVLTSSLTALAVADASDAVGDGSSTSSNPANSALDDGSIPVSPHMQAQAGSESVQGNGAEETNQDAEATMGEASMHGEEEPLLIVPVVAHTDTPLSATAMVPVVMSMATGYNTTDGDKAPLLTGFANTALSSSVGSFTPVPSPVLPSDTTPQYLSATPFSATRAEIISPPVALSVVEFPAPVPAPSTPLDAFSSFERLYGSETASPPAVCGHYSSAVHALSPSSSSSSSGALSASPISFSPSSAPPPCTMQHIPRRISQLLYLPKQTPATPDNLASLRAYVMELHTEYLSLHQHLADTHTAAKQVAAYAVDRYAECQALRESHRKATDSYHECHRAWEGAVEVRRRMEEERQVLNEQYTLCYKTMTHYKEEARQTHNRLVLEHEKLTSLHAKFQQQTSAAQAIQASLHSLEETHRDLRVTHDTVLDRVDELEKQCAYKERQCEGLRCKLQELSDEVGVLSQQHDTQFFQMTSMNNEASEYRRAIDGLNKTISELHDTGRRDRHSHLRILSYVLCSSLVKRHRLHKLALKGLHALARVRALITDLSPSGVLLPDDAMLLAHLQAQHREMISRAENVRNPRLTLDMLVRAAEDLSEPVSALTERVEHLANLNKAFFARNTTLASQLIDQTGSTSTETTARTRSLGRTSNTTSLLPSSSVTDDVAHSPSRTSMLPATNTPTKRGDISSTRTTTGLPHASPPSLSSSRRLHSTRSIHGAHGMHASSSHPSSTSVVATATPSSACLPTRQATADMSTRALTNAHTHTSTSMNAGTGTSTGMSTPVKLPLIRGSSLHANAPVHTLPYAPSTPVGVGAASIGTARTQHTQSRGQSSHTSAGGGISTSTGTSMDTGMAMTPSKSTTTRRHATASDATPQSTHVRSAWSTPRISTHSHATSSLTGTVSGLSSAPVVDPARTSMMPNSLNLKIN